MRRRPFGCSSARDHHQRTGLQASAREIAERAAARVAETGAILQLEPMPALERRWVHIALRDDPNVVTQSIGEEPDRRIVILPRPS